jgi:DNA repair photolyase
MAEKVSVKENALAILEKQLHSRAKKGEHGVIVMSSATDPYLQFEKEQQLTRGMLELILKYKFPVHVITKSDLILRDMDLLEKISRQAVIPNHLPKLKTGTIISFSFTTCDNAVSKIFEPGATPPTTRLATAQTLIQNNFHVGVSMMPLLPYISDTTVSLNHMFGEFKRIGINYILPATITLFGDTNADSRTLVFRAIKKHYPELLPKYEKLLGKNDYLPPYYNNAFMDKMKEMSREYGLKLSIIESQMK